MLLPILLWAQNYAPFHAPYMGSVTHSINQTLTSSDTITLTNYGMIYSLSINATILQPSEGSFVRIVLEDIDGHDYLVAESDWFRNDTTVVALSAYCEETAMLEGITPVLLKCYLTNATLSINSIITSLSQALLAPGIVTPSELKRQQVQSIVDRINTYNDRHGRLWVANVTQRSLADFCNQEDREESNTYISNIKYYAEGIYEIGEVPLSQVPSSTNSPYISGFDWRNRHGKNWITSVKHQGNSGLCWAFAAVASTEAMINLYYNKAIAPDLSEMDVSYYTYANNNIDSIAVENIFKYRYNNGGSPNLALLYIKNKGVIDEGSLPFIDDSIPGLPPQRTPNYEKLYKITNFSTLNIGGTHANRVDSIKKGIITKGPMVSGFTWHPNDSITKSHVMSLLGYKTIQAGDTLTYYGKTIGDGGHGYIIPDNSEYIGKTYWIFKNSYGIDDGAFHDGYMYILFKDLGCMNTKYYLKTPIISTNYSDSDIVVEDTDGDGFYNWGIGPRPAHCPAWAPEEPDGDDSDATLGPMNEYGYCASIIPTDTLYINSNEHFSNGYQYITKNICVRNNSTLTVSCDLLMNRLAEIRIQSGSTLIINGCIRNAHIKPEVGSTIILNNGGKIITHHNDSFELPVGATLQINNGTIE